MREEERKHALMRGLPLRLGSLVFGEERRLAIAPVGIGKLPLRVVEIVIGAEHFEGRFVECRILCRDQQAAVVRLQPFEIRNVPIAPRKKDIPLHSGIVQNAASLAIYRTNLKKCFEIYRPDAGGPRTSRILILRDCRAHALTASSVAHEPNMSEVKCAGKLKTQ